MLLNSDLKNFSLSKTVPICLSKLDSYFECLVDPDLQAVDRLTTDVFRAWICVDVMKESLWFLGNLVARFLPWHLDVAVLAHRADAQNHESESKKLPMDRRKLAYMQHRRSWVSIERLR